MERIGQKELFNLFGRTFSRLFTILRQVTIVVLKKTCILRYIARISLEPISSQYYSPIWVRRFPQKRT